MRSSPRSINVAGPPPDVGRRARRLLRVGGGPYPRESIDAEADRHLAALYAEPGSAPEQGTM